MLSIESQFEVIKLQKIINKANKETVFSLCKDIISLYIGEKSTIAKISLADDSRLEKIIQDEYIRLISIMSNLYSHNLEELKSFCNTLISHRWLINSSFLDYAKIPTLENKSLLRMSILKSV